MYYIEDCQISKVTYLKEDAQLALTQAKSFSTEVMLMLVFNIENASYFGLHCIAIGRGQKRTDGT